MNAFAVAASAREAVSDARRRLLRGPPTAAIVGAGSGIAIGAVAASSAQVAFGLAGAFALAISFARRSSALLVAMIVSMFAEATSLGGVAIDRLLAPVVLIGLLLTMPRGEVRIRVAPPIVWAAGYSLWALASGSWTVNLPATTSQLFSLAIALVYMLGFAAWLSSRDDLRRVLIAVTVASSAVGAFAIVTFLTHGSLDTKSGRVSGGAGDPNFFAAYQIVAIPLILLLAGELRGRGARRAAYLAAAIAFGSVLSTLSRGGLIALGVIVVLTLLAPSRVLFRSVSHKRRVALAMLVAGGIGTAAIAGALAPRLSQGGGSGRVVLWQGAITAIRTDPLRGLGYGAFQHASFDLILRTPNASLANFDIPARGQVAHSAYFGTAAELGIPGLLLFVGLVVSTIRWLRRVAARARAAHAWVVSRVAHALIVGLSGWSVASIFLSSETSRPLWVIIGIALALPKLIGRSPAQRW